MKKVLAWMLAAVWVWMSVAAQAEEGRGGLNADSVGYRFSWEEGFQEGYCGFMRDGKYGFVDQEGHVIQEPEWDDLRPFQGGFAVVGKRSESGAEVEMRYGVIDTEGRVVVEPVWDRVVLPEEGDQCGLAAVCGLNQKWGYVDLTGRVVIDPVYNDPYKISGYRYGFADGKRWLFEGEMIWADWTPTVYHGIWRYVDCEGRVLIEGDFDEAGAFSEGVCPVSVGGQYGYMDENGEMVLPPQWERAWGFVDGYAQVKKDGKWGLIDHEGQCVLACQYGDIEYCGNGTYIVLDGEVVDEEWDVREGKHGIYRMGEGMILDVEWDGIEFEQRYWGEPVAVEDMRFEVTKNEKSGMLDGNMRMLTPPEWDWIGMVDQRYMTAVRGEKEYVLDDQGNIAFGPGEYAVLCVMENVAVVRTYGNQADGEWSGYGFVNTKGEQIGESWDKFICQLGGNLALVRGDMVAGQRECYVVDGSTGQVVSDRRWAIFGDSNMMAVVEYEPFDGEYIGEYLLQRGAWMPAKEMTDRGQGKWGYVDLLTGKTAMEPAWDQATMFSEDRAWVEKEGLWYVIDGKGNVLGQ